MITLTWWQLAGLVLGSGLGAVGVFVMLLALFGRDSQRVDEDVIRRIEVRDSVAHLDMLDRVGRR